MAGIRLGRYEVRKYELPRVCAKCGAKAVARPPKTFSWHPPWLVALILLGGLGLILYIVLASSLSKRMSVALPRCERHRHYWRNRAILLYGGLAIVVIVAVLAVAIAMVLAQGLVHDAIGFACVGAGVIFLVWLFAAAIVHGLGIRAAEITENSINLTGLSEDFTEAVRQDRRGEGDEDEDDRPRRRRPRDDDEEEDRPRARRRSADEDGGYYDPDARRRRRAPEDDEEDR